MFVESMMCFKYAWSVLLSLPVTNECRQHGNLQLGEEGGKKRESDDEDVRHRGRDVDPVLPLELGPHASELRLIAVRGLDVIHDVDMDVVQDDARLDQALTFPEDIPEDDTCFRRRDLRINSIKGLSLSFSSSA